MLFKASFTNRYAFSTKENLQLNVFAHPTVGSPLAMIRPFLARLPDSFRMPSQASTTAGEVDMVFFVVGFKSDMNLATCPRTGQWPWS